MFSLWQLHVDHVKEKYAHPRRSSSAVDIAHNEAFGGADFAALFTTMIVICVSLYVSFIVLVLKVTVNIYL